MVQDKFNDNTDKEKIENNNISYNTCFICFLYHFELDPKYENYRISEDDFIKIKSEIENTTKKKKELMEITYHEKWIEKIPSHLRDSYLKDHTFNTRYININLKLSELNKSSLTSLDFEYNYQITLKEAHLDVFHTAPATVNFLFEVKFMKELIYFSPPAIYNAYQKIYSKIYEPIERERQIRLDNNRTDNNNKENDSEDLSSLKQIYDIIKDIKKILIKDRSYTAGLEGTTRPFVLFCIPKIHDKDKLKQFFSLLYQKQLMNIFDSNKKVDVRIKEIASSYSPYSNKYYFVNTSSAGLLIYPDVELIKIHYRMMEWYTYSWLFVWHF